MLNANDSRKLTSHTVVCTMERFPYELGLAKCCKEVSSILDSCGDMSSGGHFGISRSA